MLKVSSEQDHLKLRQCLENKNIQFHSFPMPSDRELKMIMKKVAPFIPDDSIVNALESEGFKINKIKRFTTREGKVLSTVLVTLPFTQESRRLLNLKVVGSIGFQSELYHGNKKPVQCFKCSEWLHTANTCHKQVKCLVCAGPHYVRECTRDTRLEDPTCGNCGGPHKANSMDKCPVYLKLVKTDTKNEEAREKSLQNPPQPRPASTSTGAIPKSKNTNQSAKKQKNGRKRKPQNQ